MSNFHRWPLQLHDWIQVPLYMRHKVPYCVTLSLRTLFRTVWLGILLILWIRKTLCDVYIMCQESHYVKKWIRIVIAISEQRFSTGFTHFLSSLINRHLPATLRFGRFQVNLFQQDQSLRCHKCNRFGHFARECANLVCFDCNNFGQINKECTDSSSEPSKTYSSRLR